MISNTLFTFQSMFTFCNPLVSALSDDCKFFPCNDSVVENTFCWNNFRMYRYQELYLTLLSSLITTRIPALANLDSSLNCLITGELVNYYGSDCLKPSP